ncbi:unnamed protein product, partial [Prorocentrum cordatum]
MSERSPHLWNIVCHRSIVNGKGRLRNCAGANRSDDGGSADSSAGLSGSVASASGAPEGGPRRRASPGEGGTRGAWADEEAESEEHPAGAFIVGHRFVARFPPVAGPSAVGGGGYAQNPIRMIGRFLFGPSWESFALGARVAFGALLVVLILTLCVWVIRVVQRAFAPPRGFLARRRQRCCGPDRDRAIAAKAADQLNEEPQQMRLRGLGLGKESPTNFYRDLKTALRAGSAWHAVFAVDGQIARAARRWSDARTSARGLIVDYDMARGATSGRPRKDLEKATTKRPHLCQKAGTCQQCEPLKGAPAPSLRCRPPVVPAVPPAGGAPPACPGPGTRHRLQRTGAPRGGAAAEAPGAQRLRASGIAALWQAGHRHLEDLSCGPYDVERDWDFTNTDVLQTVSDITTAEDCQDECRNFQECTSWSWGKMKGVTGLSDTCFLKRVRPGAVAQKFRRFGVTSGIMAGVPCEEALPDIDRKTKILGVIKVREGICLAAESPADPGSKVQMWSCVVDSTSQVWMYDETVGQIKNQAGLCLGGSHWSQDFAHVGMYKCDAGNWSQQWTFDSVAGILKIWRGNCLESGEPGVDGGSLFMHACNVNNSNQQWNIGDPTEIITDDTVSSVQHYLPGTIFCFALMLPHSYEQELLEDQESRGTGMFDCDDWMIYSNKAVPIGPKKASVIDSDLKCKMGGEFGTALNLDIFIVLWTKLVEDAVYLEHNWTVKVDPDAVFFPLRLRVILTTHTEVEGGTYINNCKYGLHGPLEVFSRNAVTAWSTGWRDCKTTFEAKCGGDCYWGEDLFIDQCLDKVLGVKRDNDFRLLLED